MPALLCHLVGDYVLQNHAMAARKTSSWAWAALHVVFYMLPFLLLTRSPAALVVMAGTHLVIDRFRLAQYWVEFWGVGREGFVCRFVREGRYFDRLNDREAMARMDAFAHCDWANMLRDPPAPAPDFLAVWLLIIVDNTAHLIINHLSLCYLT